MATCGINFFKCLASPGLASSGYYVASHEKHNPILNGSGRPRARARLLRRLTTQNHAVFSSFNAGDEGFIRQCVAEPENHFILAETAETGAETAEMCAESLLNEKSDHRA
jgi:hypothetical protein